MHFSGSGDKLNTLAKVIKKYQIIKYILCYHILLPQDVMQIQYNKCRETQLICFSEAFIHIAMLTNKSIKGPN